MAASVDVVEFQLEEEHYALDIQIAREIVEMMPITPLPRDPEYLAGIINRPPEDGGDERLLLDSSLRGVFTGRGDYTPRRAPLTGPLFTSSFTPDGAYLVYINPAAATLYDTTPQGPLMFQDAELREPPVMISPPGLLVEARGRPSYVCTAVEPSDGDAGAKLVVFWAHLGRASSDLYFADYANDGTPPTNLRLMAKGILNVSISAHSLCGVGKSEFSRED